MEEPALVPWAFPPMMSRSRSDIAVCITGLRRDLLERPVVDSFHEHVSRPLSPDVFITLSDALDAAIIGRIHKAYGTDTVVVDASEAQGPNMTFIQACMAKVGYGTTAIADHAPCDSCPTLSVVCNRRLSHPSGMDINWSVLWGGRAG